MTRKLSEQARIKLKFRSSSDTPVAYMAGRPIGLNQFKNDVMNLVKKIAESDKGEMLISSKGRYSFSVALLASWIARRSAVLPPDQHPATLKRICSERNISCEFNQAWAENLAFEQGSDLSKTHGTWSVELAVDMHAVTIYTSGSSGSPVQVKKSLGNLLDEARCLHQTFIWPSGAIVGTVLPQHLYGLSFTILLPWVAGKPWVDDVPLYPQDLSQVLNQTGAKTLISVPAHYKALINSEFTSNSLFSVSAAAPLDLETARRWETQNGQPLQEIYGSSETGIVAHRQQSANPQWKAFPTVGVAVNAGLLAVHSPFIHPDWNYTFQTSDRAKLCGLARFELHGRADSIIKIGGKRVSLQEIERSLLECDGVYEVATLAASIDSHVRDNAVWVAVVGTKALNVTTLRAQLRNKLDGVSIPRRILFVDYLPRNARGKISRQSLRALFQGNDSTYV